MVKGKEFFYKTISQTSAPTEAEQDEEIKQVSLDIFTHLFLVNKKLIQQDVNDTELSVNSFIFNELRNNVYTVIC